MFVKSVVDRVMKFTTEAANKAFVQFFELF